MILNDFDSLAMFRSDGRRHDEIRSIAFKLGVNPKYDGSAEFKIGLTEVVCFVEGPQDVSTS
jgi:ribonuclease PH